jgi:hypothetical protein
MGTPGCRPPRLRLRGLVLALSLSALGIAALSTEGAAPSAQTDVVVLQESAPPPPIGVLQHPRASEPAAARDRAR